MEGGKRKLRLHQRRDAAAPQPHLTPWPVLVVDDDGDVHDMTGVLLRDFSFDGRSFEMISARSAAEAMDVLQRRRDIPVILLDVVMETPDAGLRLVRQIRDDLGDHRTRIILRTGQPGDAPEREVVLAYDINDYKAKAELTAQRLFTALVGALRSWRDISTIANLNAELGALNASLEQRVADRTRELEDSHAALAQAKERAEDALVRETEAKRQQRQFLSMVSHEFRTPLAIIDSAAQMLQLQAEGSGAGGQRRLDSIRGGVQRLLHLIDSCLADEQLESGSMLLNEKSFDLAALLAGVVAGQRAACPGRPFNLDGPEAALAWGDADLLSLAFSNLLGNAVKYSPDGAPVTVTLEKGGDRMRVTIADQGIGVPAEDLSRIFERFHRASNARGVAGSGIGLHMVRQIVDLHDGHIGVESDIGRGSRFIVELPTVGLGEEK